MAFHNFSSTIEIKLMVQLRIHVKLSQAKKEKRVKVIH